MKLKLGLALIAAILLFEYLLLPLNQYRRDTVVEVERLRGVVAREEALAGRQAEVAAAVVEAGRRLEEISRHFYPGIDQAATLQLQLQQQVEREIAGLGARMVNLDWLPAGGAGPVIRAPVRFRLEIEPASLARLLHALENDSRLLLVEQLNLTARPRAAELTAELVVTAHGVP